MYKIIYLPEAVYVNKYLPDVKDVFETYAEALKVINSNRILLNPNMEIELWLDSKSRPDSSCLVPKHLLDIVEIK